MPTTVKLSDNIVDDARRYAAVYRRSLPKQIEYWSRIGKVAEENLDLPFAFIEDMLLAMEESKSGTVEEYRFGDAD